MALKAGYKGFKKLLSPLKLFKPGELGIDQDALVEDLNPVFFPRSEQAVLGAGNFMPDTVYQLSFASTGAVTLNTDASAVTFWAPINRNTDYWISTALGNRFRVALSTSEPKSGASATVIYTSDVAHSYKFNSGNNDYVILLANIGDIDASTIHPLLARFADTPYAPYAMTNRELTDEVEKGKNIKYTSDGTSYTNLNQYVVKPTITFASGVGTATLYKPDGETITSFAVACANSDKAVANVNVSGTTATVTLTDTSFSSTAPVTIIYFTTSQSNREATREISPETTEPAEEPATKTTKKSTKSTASADNK